MPLIVLVVLVAVILVVLHKRSGAGNVSVFAPGETYILIEDGIVRLRKGWVPARVMISLADLLRDAGVSQGHIILSPERRVAVSWHVPPALHQKIRNVLISDS
jgi:uncharacterized protein DUF3634